jgi:hypothetical protein
MQQKIERLLAGQEQLKETMERHRGSVVSRMEADRKTDRGEMKQDESWPRGNDGHVRCPS